MKVKKTLNGLGRKQAGAAIYQVMLGILVGAMFLYLAVTQFNDSMKKSRIETATQEVIQIVSTTQRMYGYSNQYNQVTTSIAVKGGAVPEHRRVAGTDTAQNNYNGQILFEPATINTANDSLRLTYSNVRGADCQQLIQNTESLARQVMVGSTQVKPTDAPVTLSTLATACDVAGTVDVSWIISRG